MLIKIFKGDWDRSDIEAHSDMFFIYSGDEEETHIDGQACIRGEPNCMSIPSKKCGGDEKWTYYNDKELEENKIVIKRAVDNIVSTLIRTKNQWNGAVLPEIGIGNNPNDGDLPNKAPKTYEYMITEIHRLIKLINRL